MDVRRLGPGFPAKEGFDFIRIDRTPSGRVSLSGSIALDKKATVNGLGNFDSIDEAERAGIAWAASHGATIIYVELPDA